MVPSATLPRPLSAAELPGRAAVVSLTVVIGVVRGAAGAGDPTRLPAPPGRRSSRAGRAADRDSCSQHRYSCPTETESQLQLTCERMSTCSYKIGCRASLKKAALQKSDL